ncbi:hypothetical protein BGX31_000641, partial [Mortierella sp. GBA43]
MFAQQFPQTSQPMRLQFPTNYHVQQQQLQQQTQQSMGMPVFAGHHPQNPNSTATPSNSYAGTIDPGLLQMSMNHPSQLPNMPLFSSPMGAGRLGSKRNSIATQGANAGPVKRETGSPDFLSSEMEFGEPGNMLSPGSTSPINSPRNDFDSPDDFNGGASTAAATPATMAKPLPMNIQHPNTYGGANGSPGNGSLYSPVESDFFPEGDFSLPNSRPLDMKFGARHMHPGSVPTTNPFHSMSMPVPRSDWFGAADGHAVGSFENPSGLQFAPGEMTGMMSSLFEEEADQ